MKTASNNKKIRELINLVKEGKLIPKPEFQRRLVWSRTDKNNFIDTILRAYPFPEIYLADGDVNLETGEGTQLLVDGLQRINTLVQYFTGDSDLKLTTVPSYNDLSAEEKKSFLQYDVAVRDLGNVSKDEIIEVFKRLNSTKYSLLDIEVSNAVYSGALKKFADEVSSNPFFETHSIFNASDYKRMGDLRYVLTIICTYIVGYFNRDEVFEELLDRYNDEFPLEQEIKTRIYNVIEFIDDCGFENNSRIWRKADLFTFMIELDNAINIKKLNLQPSEIVNIIQDFLSGINPKMTEGSLVHALYYKAALQATNDKINRLRRGFVVEELLEKKSIKEIEQELRNRELS
jgi:hypothetical protein